MNKVCKEGRRPPQVLLLVTLFLYKSPPTPTVIAGVGARQQAG
ncbi:Uncharacterized protein APZ42_001354 [Daphnia magna]|uniref:Uncharacterized protein n=1 Tax=Daphnia magna TaxID=35525 RepID=A0A164J1I1_9CRUS|nr:Uncharacterized protein APZ42_001354 [Daphnia magna]